MPPRKGSPAELLLKKVHERYLSLETYESQGRLYTLRTYPDRKDEAESHFSVLFKRPNLFRLEIWIDSDRLTPFSSLLSDGNKVLGLQFLDKPRFTNYETLVQSLQVTTGISFGISYNLPYHFLPELARASVAAKLENPKFSQPVDVEDIECKCIDGTTRDGRSVCLFIDQDLGAFERIVSRSSNNEEDFEETNRDIRKANEYIKKHPEEMEELFPGAIEVMKQNPIDELVWDESTSCEILEVEEYTDIRIDHNIPDERFHFEIPENADPFGVPGFC
ncbi:MAG: hypothetical protein KC994_13505 [Candidatus Omnitrophica bacterium]|nr:hypothetical protein [Candidatus Omnitrophota bacterium]